MSDRRIDWADVELAALGRIIVYVAELEWYAEHLLQGFIEPDGIAVLMTVGENITWKLDKLSAIAKETLTNSEVKACLLDWVEASRTLVSRRNKLIHSFYMVGQEGSRLSRWKASTRQGKWRGETEPISLVDLREVGDLLAEGLNVADHLVQQLAGCPEWSNLPGELRSAA